MLPYDVFCIDEQTCEYKEIIGIAPHNPKMEINFPLQKALEYKWDARNLFLHPVGKTTVFR